jgi:hypothetical protein
MQELSESISRANLSIRGIEEGEEYKPKGYIIYSVK